MSIKSALSISQHTEMEKAKRTNHQPHCLALAYPTQGHINPMLQFSKRLAQKGVKATLVTTKSICKTIYSGSPTSTSITFETISDGYDEGGMEDAESIQAYLESFRREGSQTLMELLKTISRSGFPVDCIVYDAFLPWALDVGKEFGLKGAVFFTQSCAVGSILYHIHKGLLKVPVLESEILLPGLPPLEPLDMPSYVYDLESYPAFFKLLVDQFSNINEADWILCNTYYELEKEVVDWMMKIWPLRTIGPNIPSMYLDKRLEDDKEYGFSIFNPNIDAWIKWLNERSKGSVAYVSFGSLAVPDAEQMEELAWGLKKSNCYFLWVVRKSHEAKLPKGFLDETSEKGLVVSWCPQMEVLAHKAIGCFITHCGWNSTLEALSLGIAMLAMPQWTDQSTNAKYIVDVWKLGIKAPTNEKGIAKREAIEHCIREIMEGERGKEIISNAVKWRILAKKAVDEGGSSDMNIEEFVTKLDLVKA